MSFIDRWRRLPYLEPDKQKFVALEMTSVVIITAGCVTLLFTLVFETTLGGIPKNESYRILRVLSGFFMVLIGLVILLFFMYRHIAALETKLDDLKAPKEPEFAGMSGEEYVRIKQALQAAGVKAPTDEEIQAQKAVEQKALAEKMNKIDRELLRLNDGETYHKCPMCGGLFTENWDTCPKCGAKVR
jgi:hypothetical protein